MKILFVCNEYPPTLHGGIGTYTKFLAESLVGQGHVVVVVGQEKGIKESYKESCNGVEVHRYSFSGRGNGRIAKVVSFYQERRNLSVLVDHVCKSFLPDIVESHDWAGPLLRKPKFGHLVVRMHGAHTVCNRWMGVSRGRSKLLAIVEKMNLRFADSLAAVSDLVKAATLKEFGMPNKGVKVIYNGVDIDRFVEGSSSQRDQNRLLFVGRLHHHKGLDLLINAVKIVLQTNKSVYLDIVGGGELSYVEVLRASIPHEMIDRVNFLGRVDNALLPDIYSGANICFVPSRVEALGIVPLEAMACGTPVFMSSLVAADEIINDNVDGFIRDPRDENSFSGCIIDVLSNQKAIDIMRKKAREKVEKRFNLEKIVSDNIKFYEECIGEE